MLPRLSSHSRFAGVDWSTIPDVAGAYVISEGEGSFMSGWLGATERAAYDVVCEITRVDRL